VTEPADLVVDAMGRSSRLADWLDDNGWQRPELVRMPIKLNYATCLFEQDDRISDAVNVLAQSQVNGQVNKVTAISLMSKIGRMNVCRRDDQEAASYRRAGLYGPAGNGYPDRVSADDVRESVRLPQGRHPQRYFSSDEPARSFPGRRPLQGR
jgi:hypothetical protein